IPERAHLIAQAFPVLRRVGAIATQQDAEVLDRQQLRALLFASLRELLGRLAAQQPLVIMIDDLQWADPDSLTLLEDLLRGQDAPAFLLVGSVRTAASDARLVSPDDLRARLPGDVRTVALGRLSADDAHELAGRLAAGLGVVEDAIVGEARGHPLFIDTLVRHRVLTGR